MSKLLLCTAVLAALCAPAWAVNKCTGADGKVAFQDAPCSGKGGQVTVRPATGDAPAAQAITPGVPSTEAQRIEGLISDSQRLRKIQEYEVRVVPDAQQAITNQRKQCDAQLQALQNKKALANDNLAGATWQASISSEMTALATRCDTHATELRDELETRRKECQALGGCK